MSSTNDLTVPTNNLILNDVTNLEVGMYVFLHTEHRTPYYCLSEGSNCNVGDNRYFTTQFWNRIIAINGNTVELEKNVTIGAGTTKLMVVKPSIAWLGDLRVNSVTSKSLNSEITIKYDYQAAGGVMEVLPAKAIPEQFTESLDIVTVRPTCDGCHHQHTNPCDCTTGNGETRLKRLFDWNPFSTDIAKNYNAGNSTIFYPNVAIYNVDAATKQTPISGKTVHEYYTINDKVNSKPLIEVTYPENAQLDGTTILAKRIIDRTAMVGMPKAIATYDMNGAVIGSSNCVYEFSEDLAGNAEEDKAGTFYNSLNTRLSSNKPLGLFEERTIRKELVKDGNSYTVTNKSVLDIIYSRPFIKSSHSKSDQVSTASKTGLYDALTGAPTVSMSYNVNSTTGDKEYLAQVNVPYYLQLDSYNTQEREQLKALSLKNQFMLPGTGFTMQSSDFNIPSTIADMIATHNGSSVPRILSAAAQKWNTSIIQAQDEITYEQYLTTKGKSYGWIGGSFNYVNQNLSGWLLNSVINKVDKYSRPIEVLNGKDIPMATIFHPYIQVQTGVIANARHEECGVFTCDYDDDNLIYSKDASGAVYHEEDWFFDKMNGWEKGLGNSFNYGYIVRLTEENEMKHFGKRCVYVEYAYGPTKNFKVRGERAYEASAWVKVLQNNLKIVAEYRTENADGTLSAPIDFAVKTIPADATKWQFVKLPVPAKYPNNSNLWIRLWVGNDNESVKAYIDDIRFAPADALVTTTYYDQNNGLPITTVNSNNKGSYIKYDSFGRVVETGVVKD